MKWIVVFILLMLASPAAAQSDQCRAGNTCGSVPWRLPAPPALTAPTAVPTINAVAGTVTPGPSPTVGATATPTAGAFNVDVSGINNQVSTISAMGNSTPIAVLNAEGTPVSIASQFETISTPAAQFFGYTKGLTGLNLGFITPFLNLLLVTVGIIFAFAATTFLLPLIASAFGFIRKIISLILEFIPG